MIYDVRHETAYTYAAPVPVGRHLARMMPVDRPGQRVLAAALTIDPTPSEWEDGRDFFDNAVSRVVLEVPHQKLVLTVRARIELKARPLPAPAETPTVDAVRRAAFASDDFGPRSPVHQLYASRIVSLPSAIRDYAAESCPDDRPILAAAIELMRRVHTDFVYEPGATDVKTLPLMAFEMRRGVCQDFAHVMIAGLRGLGIPAAYVSGYLRTTPPPGKPRLEGADATHAWVSVWCGEELGWVDLDPTNDMLTGEDHLTLAIGRDYADVAPVAGVIVGSGGQRLKVGVDVVPVVPREGAVIAEKPVSASLSP